MSKPTTSVPPHLFDPDPDVPPDHLGRGARSTCHLIGRPGDAHHTLPAGPDIDARELAAGERGD